MTENILFHYFLGFAFAFAAGATLAELYLRNYRQRLPFLAIGMVGFTLSSLNFTYEIGWRAAFMAAIVIEALGLLARPLGNSIWQAMTASGHLAVRWIAIILGALTAIWVVMQALQGPQGQQFGEVGILMVILVVGIMGLRYKWKK